MVPKNRIGSDPRGVLGDGKTPQDQLLNVYKRDPRRAATQLRLANRSTWGSEALRHEVGVYWQDTDDLFNNQTNHTVTHSRTTGAQWQASGRPDGTAGAVGWRTALSWAQSQMERDLYATNPANGQQMQRFGSYDLDASNLQALAAADWRVAPGWTVLGSLQWSQLTRDASRTSAAGLGLGFATPKLGVNFPARLRLWASVSRSQRPPLGNHQRHQRQQPAPARQLVRRYGAPRWSWATRPAGRGPGPQWTPRSTAVLDDELISTTTPTASGHLQPRGGTAPGRGAGPSGSRMPGRAGLPWSWTWRFPARANTRAADYRRAAHQSTPGWHRHLACGPMRWCPWPPTMPTPRAARGVVLLGLRSNNAEPWAVYLQADNVTDRRYASSFAIRNQARRPGLPAGPGPQPGSRRLDIQVLIPLDLFAAPLRPCPGGTGPRWRLEHDHAR